jgi:leucine dehydrogenase
MTGSAPFPFDLDRDRFLFFHDRASGLRAILCIDDLRAGPAAGGIRTRAYPSVPVAAAEVAGLARGMTIKCALAGLDAGGGKTVVLDHAAMDRPAAFRALGRYIEELDGRYHAAGDFGTTAADLAEAAAETSYVHTNEGDLTVAVGESIRRCLRVAFERLDGGGLDGRRVAIQGCGAIGAAVARVLREAGCALVVADIDGERAAAVGAAGATVVDPDRLLSSEVDALVPAALGGVIDGSTVETLRTTVLCGAANGVVVDEAVGRRIAARGIVHVPDALGSAGAVMDGIGAAVMGLADRGPLFDALETTTALVLERADGRRSADAVAEELAFERLAAR